MAQFRVVNPLQQLMQAQSTIGNAEQMRQQRVQGRQLDMNQAGQEAKFFMSAMGDVGDISTPEGMQRAAQRWGQARQALAQVSDDVEDIPEQFDPQAFQTIQGIASQYGGGKDRAKGQLGAGVIVDIDGRDYFSNPVFDPNTNTMKTELTPVAGGPSVTVDPSQVPEARVVSRTTGLTAEETPEQRRREKLASERGKGQAQTQQNIIETGVDVADSLPTLKRTLSLLDRVETGGVDSRWGIAAKQFFGVEGADEGELSANMGKAVLSQLRSTFGAAFTEREGARLEAIEAGFGKNTETNRRLINQAIALTERKVRRAIRAAREAGDEFTAEELEQALEYTFSPQELGIDMPQASAPAPATQAQPAAPQAAPTRMRYNPATGELEPQ